MELQTFEVGEPYDGERLDKFLATIYPSQSRTFFQKLIKEGQVTVNEHAEKSNFRLQPDDIVTVRIPPAVSVEILPEDIPLDILYEDADVLVVNKPKGMVVSSVGRTLFRYSGKCGFISLQRQSFRDQRRNTPGDRTPDRQRYDRLSDRVQK